jgi:site-specific DNA recombinase
MNRLKKDNSPKTLPLLNRAAIYLRVSTEDQADAYGLDVQRERCRALCVAKGWNTVAEFSDEGISGTKDESERHELSRLLEMAAAGLIDAVIVLALDRLGRKTTMVLSLVEKLASYSVVLVSCKESLDTSTPQGQFVLTMFAALAQLERDTIVERTTAGRNERGKQDGEKGGRIPYGYLRGDSGIMIDMEAARVVQKIFDMRSGGKTLTAIANELNFWKYPTTRGGKQWYASSVSEILKNVDAYLGGKRGESAVQWPSILKSSLYED